MNYSSNIVKIAGGGIAGLTAGIQLKIAGFAPIIYEQKSIIGSNRHGDYEGLENWIFEQSMSNFFEQSGFDFNLISAIPIHEFQVHTATLPPFWVRHDRPLFHMIRRGPEPSDLDFCHRPVLCSFQKQNTHHNQLGHHLVFLCHIQDI